MYAAYYHFIERSLVMKTESLISGSVKTYVYQLFAHGRWFSPGTPASSTTKTRRHDIAEILLKVALSTINQIIIYSTGSCQEIPAKNSG
jgi:hypothetical protein